MKINLSPQRRDDQLEVIINGDIVTINGDELDLTREIPDGATYRNASAIHEFLIEDIIKDENGEVEMTLLLPVGPNAEDYQNFPEPIIDPPDGVLDLPTNTYIEVEEEETDDGVKITATTYRWHQEPTVEEHFIHNPTEENTDG